jgi:hypothetical protein
LGGEAAAAKKRPATKKAAVKPKPEELAVNA